MDILSALDSKSNYSKNQLQMILAAWVLSAAVEHKARISEVGHVEEGDYEKSSIYSLLYSLYRSMGVAKSETGVPYELTFNTWGYAWPEAWGAAPTVDGDPQRFGKNAYTGLFEQEVVKKHIAERGGHVHVVEMGCGTGAGAHHVCEKVLKGCTYEAIDMQRAAIQTCRRKFVPCLAGRLVATCANCTDLGIEDGTADIVAVCETHVTDMEGVLTPEDRSFFATAHRLLKPGGFLVWGNAIPNATWQPCFDYLASLGMHLAAQRDVTREAIRARDEDQPRVDSYVEQCISTFWGFKIPVFGGRRVAQARAALKNFYRSPGTNLYRTMQTGRDSYRVVAFEKRA